MFYLFWTFRECEAGGGTLISLGRQGVEQAVTQAIDLSDYWTGTKEYRQGVEQEEVHI